MSKSSFLFAAAAFGCVALAPALAPLPALAQAARGGDRASTFMTKDHQLRASALVGKPVFNDKGETIGTVADVLVDTTGGPTMVILSVGKYLGSGTKLVAAPLDHLKLDGNHPMMAGADRQMLKALPSYTYNPMIEHGSAG